MADKKVYGICDKAWQVCVGCDPHMPCQPRCWATKSVCRTANCLEKDHPARAAFFRQALSPDGTKWSGRVLLDEDHLRDPLKWRKPALIATGFHGDVARLGPDEFGKILTVIRNCERHQFMLLTKGPDQLLAHSAMWRPLANVSLGCSIMNQGDADIRRADMAALAAMGWHTHVWREPQIERIEMRGWEFLEFQVVGGESGPKARPFDIQWARDAIFWGKAHGIATWVKQLGARPIADGAEWVNHWSCGASALPEVPNTHRWMRLYDPKGGDPAEWPEDLRVRQMPEVMRG